MALDNRQVEKPIRKVRKLLKKMPAEPTAKQVHDLRTNSRRFEAMLQATDPDESGRKTLKQLSKLRKRAGKVCDMDVLTAYAAELPRSGEEEDCSVRLLEHLGAARRKKAKQLSKSARRSAAALRRALKRLATKLQKRVGQRSADGRDPTSHITSAALGILSELEQPSTLNKSNLHPYRLRVKKLQNLLRLAENGRNQEFVESLTEVKDAIGEWHDWVELQEIAGQVIEHPRCALMRELKKRTEERLERALQVTEQMRKQYLGSGKKPAGRRKPPHPDESVWSATAALAA
jgi:CHAD domain-containing protein